MTAKKYLKQALTLDKLIKSKQSRIRDLRDKRFWISSAMQTVRVQGSPMPDKMGELMAKLSDLIDECLTDISRLLDIQQEIEAFIQKVEIDDYRLILYERYVNCKTWEEVAVDMKCTFQWVHVLHGRALNYFEENCLS